MNPAWLLWYGLQIGLSLDEAYDMALGDLLELVTVHRFKTGEIVLPKPEDSPVNPVMTEAEHAEFMNFAAKWR